ncbi:hypothetical protein [Paenibacillus sp.]|jgi:hypothetical protein|uniref:hypothetical protein n=1 Tax=Paenibacillus sp. TaxID=58172 RepID=UPI00282430D1|nr:hypothetical protein [Paenibacillus sp.]MDR0271087.1 hypothetical protein [Paenibacillus sp.]
MAGWIKNRFLITFLLLTLFVGCMMWWSARSDREGPPINQGVLDLSRWQDHNRSMLNLDGEWEFYPNQLLKPGDVPRGTKTQNYIQVPGKWNGWTDANGVMMKGKDYGTYRIVVRNAPVGEMLAIAKNYARFSDKLYIDGALAGDSGQPAEIRERYTPRNVPYTAYFKTASGEFEILLQVANYDYKY